MSWRNTIQEVPQEESSWKNTISEETREPQAEEPSMSNFDVAGLAALQSLSFGGADELKAAIEAPFSDKTYEQLRDEERALYKKAEESNPTLFNAVGIGAGFLPAVASGGVGMLAKGIQAAKNAPTVVKAVGAAAPSIAKLAGVGAAQGAVQGFGSSEAETFPELAQDVLTGLSLGGGLGVGLGVAAPVVSRAISNTAPKVQNALSNIPLVKPFLRSRELKKEGIDVTSEKAGKRIVKESEKLASDMQTTLENIYKASSKGVGKILKRSTDQGLETDISQDLARIEKAVQNTNPATAEGKASLQELQSIVDKYKQNKQILKKPDVPVKTGEEKALEKLAKKQAKMTEEANLMNEPINFTEPEVTEQFVKSVETRQGKPMVEPITTGEFSPIEILNKPELVANLNAQELQTLKRQISDIAGKKDIGDIASKRVQQAKSIVDDALKQRAIAPELVPALERVNKQIGATKDVAGLVDDNLLNYINPTEKQEAVNKLSQFLRKPVTGTSGDDLSQKKELFFNTIKNVMPNESAENIQKLANQLAEQYEYNLASRNIFGGVSLKDPGSFLGTGKGLAVRSGQYVGGLENMLGKAAEAAQVDRTLARGLAKRVPDPLKDVLQQYDQARLKNMTLGATIRKPTEGTVTSRNEQRQESMTQGIDSLNKSTTADLEAFSSALVNSGKPGAEKYADTLKKMAATDPKNRSALSFGLMSDPNFRQLYKEQMSPFGVEENEE